MQEIAGNSSSGRDRATTQPRRATSGSGWAALLFGLEVVLLLSGAGALGWCWILVLDARATQYHALTSLKTPATAVAEAPRPPDTSQPTPMNSEFEPAAVGTALAELSIPRLNVSVAVLQGSDTHTLNVGVGHIEHTAFPGQRGNVALAGHRDTFFRPLRDVRTGDDIFLATPAKHLHYRVSSFSVVNPHDLSVLDPTDQPTLTLITCYPFWVLGHAPDRFIVRAVLLEDIVQADPALTR